MKQVNHLSDGSLVLVQKSRHWGMERPNNLSGVFNRSGSKIPPWGFDGHVYHHHLGLGAGAACFSKHLKIPSWGF